MEMIKVLIVEDEAIVALNTRMKLEMLGFEITAIASTGEKAIELFKSTQPHLILMDIILGSSMDGIQASEEIRKFSNVPIIFCTAFSDIRTLERANKTLPSGFLLKPVSESQLLATLNLAVDKSYKANLP